ncbi:hypothetical protein HMPREF3229_00181 [Peptoniphilus harei]|uniref:Phage transcriptional regulator, RinA family n=1 Tax=Peptoniphilus harei TaxID=54005 RepID=A0A133PS53_9FIRM|nr:hypothetical protein [Peptoniphilus harei]KXA31653.1 hypothetical protein HMPREF3229_00181 [Peptoniphilus harei]
MTKEQLGQYKCLCLEIKELEKRLNNLKKQEVTDKVLTSASDFPYNQYELKIKGYEDDKYIEKIRARLIRRIRKCRKLRLEIEEFIEEIEDSRIRLIFELRYIQGKSWVYISNKLGSSNESYARKSHDRYLNNTKT